MLRIAQGAAELGPTGLRQSSRYFREALRCSALSTGRGKPARTQPTGPAQRLEKRVATRSATKNRGLTPI
jgi:hypothetical protein